MHIIVIGCGKVGSKFAVAMSDEGHDVVIIDNDKKAFKVLGHKFNGITITGVPIDQDILKQAGVENADVLIAVTPDDNVNIMVCQVAKELFNVPKVLARIFNPQREHVFRQFGLQTICPTDITLDVIKSIILGEKLVSRYSAGTSIVSFRNEKLSGSGLVGKRVNSLRPDNNEYIFGYIRHEKFYFSDSSEKLEEGDILVIASKSEGDTLKKDINNE